MSSLESRLDLFRPPDARPGKRWRSAFYRAFNPGGRGRRTLGSFAVTAVALGLVSFTAITTRSGPHPVPVEDARLEQQQLSGEAALLQLQLERLEAVQGYSAEYDIPADLAAAIYDISLAERLDPDLAFRLVETESSFRPRAVSTAGAVGLTQVLPSTARWLDPGVEHAALFDRNTNLRLGFRYLNMMLGYYEGDLRLALLAYNRGPNRIEAILAAGGDPANGYARRVMR